MNKSELVKAIAEKAEITQAVAGDVLNAVVEVIGEAIAHGDEVVIPGFGSFGVAERAARTGRNPKTGETIQIAASKTPTFKAGKALKDKCN